MCAVEFYLLFEELNLPRELAVYEPGVGAEEPVILATEGYSKGNGKYLTINLNKNLQKELIGKIDNLKLSVIIFNKQRRYGVWNTRRDKNMIGWMYKELNLNIRRDII